MCGRRDAADLGLRGNDTLAAVVPHPGDVLLLSESGSPGVRSFSPLRSLLPDVAEKAEHQEVTVTGVATCVQPTHSRAAFASWQHTHGRRATHLRSGPARAGRRGCACG